MKSSKLKKTAIVYHVFPHYRKAVMEKLLDSDAHEYVLYADAESPKYQPLKVWSPEDESCFVRTRNYYIPLGYKKHGSMAATILIQSKLLRLALRSDVKNIVYLADSRSPSYWLSAVVARLMRKRVVYWSHGMLTDEKGLKNLIRVTFWRFAHAQLFYGHRARNFAICRGFPRQNLHTVYNSLDYETQRTVRDEITPEEVKAAREELFDKPNLPLLTSCSRLEGHPRFDLLIEAVALLKEQGFPCNVLLIGDGTQRENLEALAKEKDVPVHFYGACYDPKKVAVLTMGADLTVCPGAIGLAAITSMTFGTPVITHDTPEAQGPEWESVNPGENGDFFTMGDVPDLARVIREWIETHPDRNANADNCRRMIENYFNPDNQKRIIEQAIAGEPADEDPYWVGRFYDKQTTDEKASDQTE
jgi:glycosyltransferase involved in cell wall biosynthesis